MNNTYKIKIESPLLRAGVTIETECSEKYLVPVMKKCMEKVREINKPVPVRDPNGSTFFAYPNAIIG